MAREWDEAVTQFKDLEGVVHNYGDQQARDEIDNSYSKKEADETFRRIDDSFSADAIHEMFDAMDAQKANKADVYTITETDFKLEELENRCASTSALIRATVAQLSADTELHFQNLETDIDDNYYTKEEVDGIAEELDLTKQNSLVSDGTIVLTPLSDGKVQIGTMSGTSILDDTSDQPDKTWSAQKLVSEKNDLMAYAREFIPVGTVFPYSGSIVDEDFWLICDGRSVSRTTYSKLFSLIGVTYGEGDGSTTFNVPDLRDRAIMGTTNITLIGAIESDSVGPHSHTLNDPGHSHGVTDPGHNHSQNAHGHTINDPGHSHSISVQFNGSDNSGTAGQGNILSDVGHRPSPSNQFTIYPSAGAGASGTGISVNNATASNNAATTGVTVDDATTGISINNNTGTETKPKNVRMNFIIKAV